MNVTIACFLLILGCSCRRTSDDATSAKPGPTVERQQAVRKILAQHFHSAGDDAVIRGPLSVEEVQKDLDDRGKQFSDKGHEMTFGGPEWDRMKANLGRGDELYYFKSDRRSWAELLGWEGYLVIRGETITDSFFVSIN